MGEKEQIRALARNAFIAAVYFVLTIVLGSLGYLNIQVRISEALIFLCFFRKDYTIGITLGCLIANLFSPVGTMDVIFGTLATLISCLLVSFSKQMAIAAIFPVAVNAFIIGAELYFVMEYPFWMSVLEVAIGELIAIAIGCVFFFFMGKRKKMQLAMGANQNLNFKW